MIDVRVGGVPVRSLGKVGDLTWSTLLPGGCKEASWSMAGLDRVAAPREVRVGARVEIATHGVPLWAGVLDEPGYAMESFTARGLSSEGERYLNVDYDGDPTTDLSVAINAQIGDGLPWTYDANANPAPTGLPKDSEFDSLAAALDVASEAAGKRWGVDERGAFFCRADPTIPMYHCHVPVLGRVDDDYFTHLVGRYVTTEDVDGNPTGWDHVEVGDETAAARYGRSTRFVDLTLRGLMSAPTATNYLTGRLTLGSARLGFSERLELADYELLRADGSRAFLPMVKAGEMVRLHGALSPETRFTGLSYIDIVIGETSYTEGSTSITIAPTGLAARSLTDVLAKIRGESLGRTA